MDRCHEVELKSMEQNEVWDLVKLHKGYKKVGYKWIFKTRCDSNGNIKWYKAKFVAKYFSQRNGVGYKETF